MTSQTAILQVGGLHWATSQAVVEQVLARRPGVLSVQANAVGQTATVRYDPARTSVAELTGWIRDCGYHCAGQSVPDHVCDPLAESGDGHHDQPMAVADHGHYGVAPAPAGDTEPGGAVHDHARPADAHAGHAGPSGQEMMGHGGHHRERDWHLSSAGPGRRDAPRRVGQPRFTGLGGVPGPRRHRLGRRRPGARRRNGSEPPRPPLRDRRRRRGGARPAALG